MQEMLQFLVMVDSELNDSALLALVLTSFPDAVQVQQHSCDVRGNGLEIWANDSDGAESVSEEDAYLGYPWRVEVIPLTATVDEDHQVALARGLRDCFQRAGATAVICAGFENRV